MDLDLAAELFPSWIAHGQMTAQMMDLDEVGATIVSLVQAALANSGTVCEQVMLRPRGGLLDATDAMIAYVQTAQEKTPQSL
jgi:hypothetical protein